MSETSCPGCGAPVATAAEQRDAQAFCASCDYPLFWAGAQLDTGIVDPDVHEGLRRLPGTAGHVTVGMITCWQCREPNPVTNTYCLRCGADLSGPPVLATEPEPVFVPPPPPPPSPEPVLWPLLVMVVLIVLCVAFGLVVWD